MLCTCSEGAAKIAIHEKMAEDELTFYFGETSYDKIGSMYDVGLLKKVKKPHNLAQERNMRSRLLVWM